MKQENLFCIAALKIGKDCSELIRKNLKPGFYLFNNRCRLEKDKIVLNPEYNIEDNIYGENIFLHAIVGMNGSGKSSLIELIYRMVNNFSFFVNKKVGRKSNLLFICDLDAELYYTINNVLYTLVCKGKLVYLIEKKNDDEEIIISENDSDFVEIMKNFFYSIATNYSIQSLISADYKGEKCVEMPGVGWTTKKSWIHRIFHKNDGYATPIVLNPYRSEEGWIDAGKEERFTISRLSSLLYYFKKRRLTLINEYGLDNISFNYDFQYVMERLKPWYTMSSKVSVRKCFIKMSDNNRIFKLDSYLKENSGSFFGIIAKEFGYSNDVEYDDIVVNSYAYLAYKVLSIASKYTAYSEFEELGGVYSLDRFASKKEKEMLTLLVDKIKKDDVSHVTIKIHQTLNFLNNYDKIKQLKNYSIEDYLSCLSFNPEKKSLMELKRHLPPPFFIPSVLLYKKQQEGKKKIGNIPFEKLSSGERQLFSTLSTCVYHMENLLSVKSENLPKYSNINLIFEEIEISFHPDFQRCFVNNLISMIERLGYNQKFMINIILVTHSPFVLSDIPKQNILYLKNGKDVSNDIHVNPFAASICDVLHQSFFLENGFIGAFAQKQIDKLIDSINGKEKNDKGKIVSRINNLIGEPVIREYMLDKVAQKE